MGPERPIAPTTWPLKAHTASLHANVVVILAIVERYAEGRVRIPERLARRYSA
jgi:hypothetical protein